jgi:hypothetical protein
MTFALLMASFPKMKPSGKHDAHTSSAFLTAEAVAACLLSFKEEYIEVQKRRNFLLEAFCFLT